MNLDKIILIFLDKTFKISCSGKSIDIMVHNYANNQLITKDEFFELIYSMFPIEKEYDCYYVINQWYRLNYDILNNDLTQYLNNINLTSDYDELVISNKLVETKFGDITQHFDKRYWYVEETKINQYVSSLPIDYTSFMVISGYQYGKLDKTVLGVKRSKFLKDWYWENRLKSKLELLTNEFIVELMQNGWGIRWIGHGRLDGNSAIIKLLVRIREMACFEREVEGFIIKWKEKAVEDKCEDIICNNNNN